MTLYEATQWVLGARNVVADTLGMRREDVHIVSSFVGGGFGCKGFIWPHSVCAAIAARHVGRPVRVALTRQQMFTSTGHRGATRQKMALGADASGRLLAIEHENLTTHRRWTTTSSDAASSPDFCMTVPTSRF